MNPGLARPSVDECSPYYATYIQLVSDGDIVRTLQTQHLAVLMLIGQTGGKEAASSVTTRSASIGRANGR